MERPKRFLGSARRIDPGHGGGSLTIIATALVDTGSREVRTRVAHLAARRREERARALAASGADHVRLETGTDYALPLRRAFALRARRIHRA